MASTPQLRIGTSGWHYKHWLGTFYPERLPPSKMLQFYLERFETVELNNSFYRLPKIETMAGWRDATSGNFLFAVKASRFLTHNKKLKEPEHALNNFLPRAEALGKKLGPILFHLPPKWRINRDRLEEFLQALPPYHRYTFEFREPTWLCDDVYRLLTTYNAAFCVYDIGGFHSPILTTADFAYVRLHGPGKKYQGSYSHRALETWAKQIDAWAGEGKSVFVYFDNDQAAYAALNGLALRKLLRLP